MNFLVLPPEVNSARIYAGAGAGPMLAAAAAWDGLAADLRASAASFGSVISALIGGPWLGPASAAMAGTAAPYASWLVASAAKAEGAAAQARAAATAFEAAQVATVHPVAVAANRSLLTALVATNFLGQNTPAIAATEFDYVEMWAQDVAAMVGYHAGAISLASVLVPFGSPPIRLAGLAAQAAAADPAAAPGMMTSTLQGLVQAAVSGAQLLTTPAGILLSPLMSLAQGANGGAGLTGSAAAGLAAADVPKFAGATAPEIKPSAGGGGLGSAMSAGLGKARLVGSVSVPPTWPGSMPARMASSAMAGLTETPSAAMAQTAGAAGGMPMMPMPMGGGMGGGMAGGTMARGGASPHLIQNRPSVIPRIGVG